MDERLKFYEAEWQKARAALQESQDEQNRLALELLDEQRSHRRAREVQQILLEQRDRLAESVRCLQNDVERLTKDNSTLKHHIEEFKQQLAQPSFFLEMIEKPFALELEMFDVLPELVTGNAAANLTDWAVRVVEMTESLEATFTQDAAEEVRRHLIAHWVYVRWLELMSISEARYDNA